MLDDQISLDTAINCVKAAIQRAERADELFREAEANAFCRPIDRMNARALRDGAEREFAWQWRNVKRIFEAKGI